MDIRYAKPADGLQPLWRACFQEDGTEYFAREYDPDRVIVAADEADKAAAMLHWLPQTVSVPGRGGASGGEINAAYFLGIGTGPEHRGKGLAGDLVEQMLFELYLRGVTLAFLLPCGARMAQFYQKYGFRQIGLRPVSGEMPEPDGDERLVKEITPPVAETLDALYQTMYASCAHPRRGAERWARIAAEYDVRLGEGRYRVYDGGTLMEDSSLRLDPSGPRGETGACVRVIRAEAVREVLSGSGYTVPNGPWYDAPCPWNGRVTGGADPGMLLDDLPFAANLLYNERVD